MLMKMFKMMKKGNKGFTLVELMVVVVIIGVLTAIAVPVYNNVTEKAKLNAIAANLRIINGAISQYRADNDVSANPTQAQVTPYLQSWPANNPKGVTYGFTSTGTYEATATLSSALGSLNASTAYTLSQVQAVINAAPAAGGSS